MDDEAFVGEAPGEDDLVVDPDGTKAYQGGKLAINIADPRWMDIAIVQWMNPRGKPGFFPDVWDDFGERGIFNRRQLSLYADRRMDADAVAFIADKWSYESALALLESTKSALKAKGDRDPRELQRAQSHLEDALNGCYIGAESGDFADAGIKEDADVTLCKGNVALLAGKYIDAAKAALRGAK